MGEGVKIWVSDKSGSCKPFDVWFKEKYPDACMTCYRTGKLERVLPATGIKHIIECPECNGTGHAHRLQEE
jgi:hypothetical protein